MKTHALTFARFIEPAIWCSALMQFARCHFCYLHLFSYLRMHPINGIEMVSSRCFLFVLDSVWMRFYLAFLSRFQCENFGFLHFVWLWRATTLKWWHSSFIGQKNCHSHQKLTKTSERNKHRDKDTTETEQKKWQVRRKIASRCTELRIWFFVAQHFFTNR